MHGYMFLQAASREEEGQSGMTVNVYKAQIADLSRKAATLEKVFKHYKCPVMYSVHWMWKLYDSKEWG